MYFFGRNELDSPAFDDPFKACGPAPLKDLLERINTVFACGLLPFVFGSNLLNRELVDQITNVHADVGLMHGNLSTEFYQ